MKDFIIKCALAVLVLLTVSVNPIFSSEKTWTNAIAGNLWTNPLNWSPFGVPEAEDSILTLYGDVLVIPTDSIVSIKYLKLLGNLTIKSGAVLNITNGHFNSNGDVLNQGTINISNSPTYGLKQSTFQSDSRPFTNEGSIFIDNSADAGLWIRYDQTFTNKAGGVVEITNSAEASIELLGTISNKGIIRARTSDIDLGLLMEDIESSFVNLNCAETNIRDKLVISNGLFNNFGLLRQTYDGTNEIESDLLINYEIIEDIFSSFEETDIMNFSVWIKSYDQQILEGEPTNIFSGSFPASRLGANIYLDNTMTTSAGTYDNVSNLWIPNGSALGNTTFFVEYTQDNGACSDVLKFNIESSVVEMNYWLGGIGNWGNSAKWSKTLAPSALDRVGIYGETDHVNMLVTGNFYAKDMLLKGKLTIGDRATFTIDNPTEVIGLNIKEGELVNNGKLELKNAEVGAYFNNADVENNGEIICMGNDVCIELTRLGSDGSTFINNGTVYSDTARAIQSFRSGVYNYGTITADLDGDGTAVDGDTIYNYGTLNIKGNDILKGEGLASFLQNMPSGVVNISKLEVGMFSSGANYGNISIDTCSTGVLTPSSDFFNMNGGVFNINQCREGIDISFTEFYNEPGGKVFLKKNELGINMPSSSELYNEGLIEIDSTLTFGIYCQGNIINELSARIIIDNSLINGLYLDGSNADIYCRDQSRILVRRSADNDIFLEDGNLWLEDNGEVKIGADPEE